MRKALADETTGVRLLAAKYLPVATIRSYQDTVCRDRESRLSVVAALTVGWAEKEHYYSALGITCNEVVGAEKKSFEHATTGMSDPVQTD